MKTFLSLFILQLLLVFPGCSIMDTIRGGPKEPPLENKISSQDLHKRNVALEQELQRTMDDSELGLARAKDENRRLVEKIKELQDENQGLKNDIKTLEGRTREAKSSPPPPVSEPVASEKQPEKAFKTLKIKVLSGTGELNSAKRLAMKLRKMGYEIGSLDYAPRKNFSEDTVYFAPKLKEEAESLASSLGGGKVLKAMTWSSAFDLIIVTGGKP